MKSQQRKFFYLVVVLAIAVFLYFKKNNKNDIAAAVNTEQARDYQPQNSHLQSKTDIRYLSSEQVVVAYLKANNALPNYYITKREAQQMGWNPREGNLCDKLPGRVIGGDHFSNREGGLPSKNGRKWFEADINFECGHRQTDRLLYSSDHLIYITHNHYQTFEQQ